MKDWIPLLDLIVLIAWPILAISARRKKLSKSRRRKCREATLAIGSACGFSVMCRYFYPQSVAWWLFVFVQIGFCLDFAASIYGLDFFIEKYRNENRVL